MALQSVQIPAPSPLARRSPVASRTVALPLHVRTRDSLNLVCAVVLAGVALLAAIAVVTALWVVATGPLAWPGRLALAATIPVAMTAILVALPMAWTCLADAARLHAVLVLTADRIEDRRIGLVVAWSDVTRVRIVHAPAWGPVRIELVLVAPVAPASTRFRIGSLHLARHRPSGAIAVPLVLLNSDPSLLAHVVAALVARHGGDVVLA